MIGQNGVFRATLRRPLVFECQQSEYSFPAAIDIILPRFFIQQQI